MSASWKILHDFSFLEGEQPKNHEEAFYVTLIMVKGFLGGSGGKGSASDMDLMPELGRSPGEGNGNPLQYSYLGNSMGRGAWRVTVHGVTKESDTTEQLNNSNHGQRIL